MQKMHESNYENNTNSKLEAQIVLNEKMDRVVMRTRKNTQDMATIPE